MATKFIPYHQVSSCRDEAERLIHHHHENPEVRASLVNLHRLHDCLMSELDAIGPGATKAGRTRFRVNLNTMKHQIVTLRRLIQPKN